MQLSIPCSIMRGGTSKGLYFLAEDLPAEPALRDPLLLSLMGSPDERQIDGLGGAHPLTSKVAIVSKSTRVDADVDYLFLQVVVDKAQVSDAQNCGNILAGVGPFAIEQGLVAAGDNFTDVRIHMLNTGANAVARVQTPQAKVNYSGDAKIDGVPGSSAPVLIDFLDIAGSSCGSLFPSGNSQDVINNIAVTCIDNGMPVVLLNAADFALQGDESPAELEANHSLKEQIEAIRLKAGELMNLGDVTKKTVPKMTLISKALNGGLLNTRSFIPHRVHDAIGVLGSVSVATACVLKGTVAHDLLQQDFADGSIEIVVEHPTGQFNVEMEVSGSDNIASFQIHRAALLRTARLLMRGEAMANS
ncbi:4-oxalomesaconate tautomerase [Paraglaciecola hydrolytica]|uniref:4-oxalomesaconate tautomerase n=1 Tax=Paraglaciecola hydrolytica TaxID=1799789 RepID=A0A148KK70_9ALTE|nr:4-oxalomesaconate tautomerase [Paraglaciecola hydrolytica]KXI26714.1 4-oxalomesaconate tautomerase [Paraglaciecola hydrolytica]